MPRLSLILPGASWSGGRGTGLSYRLDYVEAGCQPGVGRGSAGGCRSSELSAGLLQGVDDLLQDVGAVVSDLLENSVGELLQLSALLLTHLQLSLQLEGNKELVYFYRLSINKK